MPVSLLKLDAENAAAAVKLLTLVIVKFPNGAKFPTAPKKLISPLPAANSRLKPPFSVFPKVIFPPLVFKLVWSVRVTGLLKIICPPLVEIFPDKLKFSELFW